MCSDSTPDSGAGGRGRADGDPLKSSKSESTLYPADLDPAPPPHPPVAASSPGPGPAKSVPNLDGMGTPDELKIRLVDGGWRDCQIYVIVIEINILCLFLSLQVH